MPGRTATALARRRLDLAGRWPFDVEPPRAAAIAVIAMAGGAALLTRLTGVDATLQIDETSTIRDYVVRGPSYILTNYSLNNHVLFSLLAWLAQSVAGGSEVVYRFFGVVPALVAFGLAVWWTWRRLGVAVAAGLTFLVTLAPVNLEWPVLARGYGLALLAAVVMLVGAVGLDRAPTARSYMLFAGGGLVGIWTLPLFVVGFVAHAAVLLGRPALRRNVIVAVAAVGFASALFYAPLALDLVDTSGDETVSTAVGSSVGTLGVHAPLTAPSNQFLVPILTRVLLDDPARDTAGLRAVVLVAVYLPLALLGIRRATRLGHRLLAAHLIAPVIALFGTLTLLRSYSHPRFASFLVVHVMLLLAIGAVELVKAARPRMLRRAAVVVFACGFVPFALVRLVQLDEWLDATPPIPFRHARDIVDASGIDRVILNGNTSGFLYYLGDDRVQQPDASRLQDVICSSPAPFVFVHYERGTPVDTSCLASRGAVRFDLPDRGGTERDTTLWVMSAES